MLSEERIAELWEMGYVAKLTQRAFAFARAIEAECAKVQAEKQEPVKDEPVAWCVAYDDPRMGRIHSDPSMYKPELEALISRAGNPLALVPLYTRPQPDLTAEVEFMQGKYEEMLEEWLPQKQRIAELEKLVGDSQHRWASELNERVYRIAELEEAARQARWTLQYHTEQTRPILSTMEAIAKLDAVFGNAGNEPTPD